MPATSDPVSMFFDRLLGKGQGTGTNHAGESFTAKLTAHKVGHDGRQFSIRYVAELAGLEEPVHEEQYLLVGSSAGWTGSYTSTHTTGLLRMRVREEPDGMYLEIVDANLPGGSDYGVRITRNGADEIHYAHIWAIPGQPPMQQSAAVIPIPA